MLRDLDEIVPGAGLKAVAKVLSRARKIDRASVVGSSVVGPTQQLLAALADLRALPKRTCARCSSLLPKGARTWCPQCAASRQYVPLSESERAVPARICRHCGNSYRRTGRGKGGKSVATLSYCSRECAHNRITARPVSVKGKSNHDARVAAAPGLTVKGIASLRRAWMLAGRRCAYCDRPATAVDHIRPLSRGGDNEIGNLAPVCKPCNSSKGAKLLTEWFGRLPGPLSVDG